MYEDDFETGLPGTLVGEREPEQALVPPSMYDVVVHNDDYTPMEFVVVVLQTFFNMSVEKANAVMYQIHTQGKAICAVCTRDLAETKVGKVTEFSRKNSHPLLCTMDKISE